MKEKLIPRGIHSNRDEGRMMIIGKESGIGNQVCLCSLLTNTVEKGMNPFLPQAKGKIA